MQESEVFDDEIFPRSQSPAGNAIIEALPLISQWYFNNQVIFLGEFMTEIKFSIEGEDAILATEKLLAIEGITGNYAIDSEEVKKEAVITTVATIVGLVGGAIAIAEQIRKWYLEYKQNQSGKKIAKVLIVGRNGRRLLLENATIEQIRQILES
ncbi:hypothetical protein [Anabaena azotica]|uniref:hypothetical protein n=1 Tax=Anabaena azotica TaxID=197653 RepID=UPI0039A40AB1